jgi:hypothetical protein
MRLARQLIIFFIVLLAPVAALAQGNTGLIPGNASVEAAGLSNSLPDAPKPQYVDSNIEPSDEQPGSQATANISGTVTDANGDTVAGATIVLEGAHSKERLTTVANDNGAFQLDSLKPGVPYRLTISAKDLEDWVSPNIVLTSGQYLFLSEIKLKIPDNVASVTVYATQEQIATEQVTIEEKQRVFGIIPNFFVTYDPHPVPLTTKLKFRLAYKASTDPVTFFGIAFMAAVYQAGDVPNYQQGWDGYAQRFGAGLADTTTDVFFGGAILPWLFHQDPRYFYQGTGTKKSRALHALSSPYVCRGDNGKSQPNISSLGGDLISGAISNIYYPESNRGPGLVFQGFFITTGVRTVNALIQEFVLRRFTPSARHQN